MGSNMIFYLLKIVFSICIAVQLNDLKQSSKMLKFLFNKYKGKYNIVTKSIHLIFVYQTLFVGFKIFFVNKLKCGCKSHVKEAINPKSFCKLYFLHRYYMPGKTTFTERLFLCFLRLAAHKQQLLKKRFYGDFLENMFNVMIICFLLNIYSIK